MPGPREPKNVDPYLEPLLLDLLKYGPKGEDLLMNPVDCGRPDWQHLAGMSKFVLT